MMDFALLDSIGLSVVFSYSPDYNAERPLGSSLTFTGKVLSELKPHLGIEPDFCYPIPDRKCEREAENYELSLLCCIHNQKTSKENRGWLCTLLVLSMQTDL